MIQVITANPQNVLRAADLLRQGELVAFPTETVYGLGAHALDETAVGKVYSLKGRPSTDPLIVHVSGSSEALPYIQANDETLHLFQILAQSFWPGPLTMVLPKSPLIPSQLTAGKETVALRCPHHPVALALLKASGIPIAAPSANLFGHVSPTEAGHVIRDFPHQAITVLDGGPCAVGIESTIVSLVEKNCLTILRQGIISAADLKTTLERNALPIPVHQKLHHSPRDCKEEGEAQDAPGQLLRHYAPFVPAAILQGEAHDSWDEGMTNHASHSLRVTERLSRCVVVDFGAKWKHLSGRAHAYRDLSPSGDILEAAREVYRALRWAEEQGGFLVLLPDLKDSQGTGAFAISDRLFRAATGRHAGLTKYSDQVVVSVP